jgi:hypothetical protein
VSDSDPGRESRLKHRFGMSRRDLLRRGAVVGGTLLWTIPVVKTISSAHETATGSPAFVCCECIQPKVAQDIGTKKCGAGHTPTECHADDVSVATESQCQSYCNGKSKAYCFHNAPSPIGCTGNACGAH